MGCMPRYFFDVHDGERFVRDEDGTELDGPAAAAEDAAVILAELAKARLPGWARRDISVQVRNDVGPVLRAALSFAIDPLA